MPVFPDLGREVSANDNQARVVVFETVELSVRIGVYDGERLAPQRVRVSLELLVKPKVADPDDRIGNVLDYDRIHAGLVALAEGPHIDLQETLAERIAALCLEPDEVAAVRVFVSKPDAYPDCESVGIRIVRTRG